MAMIKINFCFGLCWCYHLYLNHKCCQAMQVNGLKMVYKNGQELLSPNNALAFMSGENKSCMRRASVVQVHLQRSSILFSRVPCKKLPWGNSHEEMKGLVVKMNGWYPALFRYIIKVCLHIYSKSKSLWSPDFFVSNIPPIVFNTCLGNLKQTHFHMCHFVTKFKQFSWFTIEALFEWHSVVAIYTFFSPFCGG